MKKIALIVVGLILVTSAAQAHPPQDIKIAYDKSTKMLDAQIIHPVSSPLTHYIDEVELGRNGKKIVVQKISQQENNQSQTVRYYVPEVAVGDVLSVEGECNISGKLTKKITVQ